MLRVVGCIFEYEGKFVLLHRRAHKPNGNTWGLPAGKVEPDESDEAAMLRELREETGYEARLSELRYVREDEYQFDGDPFVFVVYKLALDGPYDVKIEAAAHQAYQWITWSEAMKMPDLVPGLHTVLELVSDS